MENRMKKMNRLTKIALLGFIFIVPLQGMEYFDKAQKFIQNNKWTIGKVALTLTGVYVIWNYKEIIEGILSPSTTNSQQIIKKEIAEDRMIDQEIIKEENLETLHTSIINAIDANSMINTIVQIATKVRPSGLENWSIIEGKAFIGKILNTPNKNGKTAYQVAYGCGKAENNFLVTLRIMGADATVINSDDLKNRTEALKEKLDKFIYENQTINPTTTETINEQNEQSEQQIDLSPFFKTEELQVLPFELQKAIEKLVIEHQQLNTSTQSEANALILKNELLPKDFQERTITSLELQQTAVQGILQKLQEQENSTKDSTAKKKIENIVKTIQCNIEMDIELGLVIQKASLELAKTDSSLKISLDSFETNYVQTKKSSDDQITFLTKMKKIFDIKINTNKTTSENALELLRKKFTDEKSQRTIMNTIKEPRKATNDCYDSLLQTIDNKIQTIEQQILLIKKTTKKK